MKLVRPFTGRVQPRSNQLLVGANNPVTAAGGATASEEKKETEATLERQQTLDPHVKLAMKDYKDSAADT